MQQTDYCCCCLQILQAAKGYKGYASGSPDSIATTAGEDRVPGHENGKNMKIYESIKPLQGGPSNSNRCEIQQDVP